MGPTGPSARTAPYFFFFFAAFFFFAIVSPPPAPARPAVLSAFPRLYGRGPRSVKRKIHDAGVVSTSEPNILGPGTLGRDVVALALLAHRGGLAMLATADEFLVERHPLLAHRARLGRVRRKIPTHEAEDFLSADLRLLRAAPESADPDDLSAQLLDELAQ